MRPQPLLAGSPLHLPRRRVPARDRIIAVGAAVLIAGAVLGHGTANAAPFGSPGGSSDGGPSGSLIPEKFDNSALVTEDQRRQEALARKVLDTGVMHRAIEQTKMHYAADPRGSTPSGQANISRAANSMAATAVLATLGEDTDRPVLTWATTAAHRYKGLDMPNSGYGIENPDNVYRQTLFAGNSQYEIRGKKADPGPVQFNFEVRDAIPGTTVLTPEAGKQIASLSDNQIHFEQDGTFVVTVSSEPANGRPNHLQIPADGTVFMVVRDLLNDWSRELPTKLEVARTAGPPAAAPRSVDQLATRSAETLSKIGPFWTSYFNTYVYVSPANTLIPVRERPGGRGLSTNGWFDLADDQAFVITVDPVGAESLGIQITDPWALAYEYRERTSSLNTTQSKPNQDGTYTFVISKNDPGVANWLDPSGNSAGLIAIRWQELSSAPSVDRAVRSVEVVRVGDLPATLPKMSPEQRAIQNAQRAENYDHRMMKN